MQNKNILVTGGCGFIGSHLAKKLIRNGKHVIGVDNLSYGFKDNVSDLEGNDNFEFFNFGRDSKNFVSVGFAPGQPPSI